MNVNLFAVRKAQSLDGSAVSALEQQCVRESQSFRGSAQLLAEAPFIGSDFDMVLGNTGRLVLVVESSGDLCGFADMKISDDHQRALERVSAVRFVALPFFSK